MKLVKLGIIALSICSTSVALATDYKIDNIPIEGLLYYDSVAKTYFAESGTVQPPRGIFFSANHRKAFDNYVRACQHFKNDQAPDAAEPNFVAASCSEVEPEVNVGPYARNRGWQYQSFGTVIVNIPDGKSVATNAFDIGGVETPDRSQAIGTYFEDCFEKLGKIRAIHADKYVYAHCGSREESGAGKNFLYHSKGTVFILDELNSGGDWWDDVNTPVTPQPVDPVEPVTPQPVNPVLTCDKLQLNEQIRACSTSNNVMQSQTAQAELDINSLSSSLIGRESNVNRAYSDCQRVSQAVSDKLSAERTESQEISANLVSLRASSQDLRSDLESIRSSKNVEAWSCTVSDGKYPQNGRNTVVNESKVKALSAAFDACLATQACVEHGYNWTCSPTRLERNDGPGGRKGGPPGDRRGGGGR